MVEVCMTPSGCIHEIGCRWVQGRLAKNPSKQLLYVTMPASQAPSNKKHCSYC
jgi:hypothetical protein